MDGFGVPGGFRDPSFLFLLTPPVVGLFVHITTLERVLWSVLTSGILSIYI